MAVLSSPIKSTSSLARKQKTEGKVKGADSVLKATSKKLQLPEEDNTPVTITKVNKIVETKVKKLQPKITKKVAAKITPFDPRKMLTDIFKGGLGQLEKFAKGLASLKKPLGEIFKFINKAKSIFLNLLKKLTKIKLAPKEEDGKKPKKKKGGLIGNILKGAATLGLIALTTWGVTKLMKKGREREVKPGDSQIKSVEPLEGTELLDKKEVKKFNKALKVLQQALWDFEEQVKKAADAKAPSEEETKDGDKPKTDNEKVQSLAGTTQTALIPGELAPSQLNVLVPPVGGETTTEESKGNTTSGGESSVTKKSKVMQHDADHSTSGGTTGSGGTEGSGDGSTSTSKTKPLGTENFQNVQVGNTNISYNKTEHQDGSITETYSSSTTDPWELGAYDDWTVQGPDGTTLRKGDEGWKEAVQKQLDTRFEGKSGKVWLKDNPHLQAKVNASKKESNLRSDNAGGISQTSQGQTHTTTNEQMIPVPIGKDPSDSIPQSGTQAVNSAGDSGSGNKVPFLLPFDNNNIAIMFSKITYNIVDAL